MFSVCIKESILTLNDISNDFFPEMSRWIQNIFYFGMAWTNVHLMTVVQPLYCKRNQREIYSKGWFYNRKLHYLVSLKSFSNSYLYLPLILFSVSLSLSLSYMWFLYNCSLQLYICSFVLPFWFLLDICNSDVRFHNHLKIR